MPIKYKSRFNFYTADRTPNSKRETRIKMPGVPKRPVRFQVRSLLDMELISPPPPPGLVIHRKGPYQMWMGIAPLEMRATPHSEIAGTLPERIIYKYLTEVMHFSDGIDFNFQSSLQGGRVDTGGIVADFMFPALRVVLNPLGPTHLEFLRIKKDEEQINSLAALGYQVYMIPEDDVYNEDTFDRLMNQIFGWEHYGSGPNTNEELSLENLLKLESAIATL